MLNSFRRIDLPALVGLLALLAWARPAGAVIEQLTPLADFIQDADEIIVARVTALDRARPVAVLEVVDDLKGRAELRRMPVNLKGRKPAEIEQLLARLADDLSLVVFITHDSQRDLGYAYTNGTWFQLIGHRDGKLTRWGFTDLEIYLPRTFNGSTDELRATLTAAIAGQRKPPPANPKVKPGLGPIVDRQRPDPPAGQ